MFIKDELIKIQNVKTSLFTEKRKDVFILYQRLGRYKHKYSNTQFNLFMFTKINRLIKI